jgi:hypothetical protein
VGAFVEKRRASLTFVMSVCPYTCIGEAHSGRNSLNLLFETFMQPVEGTHVGLKSVKLLGNLLKDPYASFTVAGYIISP